MATNRVFRTRTLRLYVGTGKTSGQSVIVGSTIRGVCLTAADSLGMATVDLGSECEVYRLSVLASTDDTTSPLSGASAVAMGDAIYQNVSSGVVSKDSTGTTKLGVALGTANANGAYANGTQVSAGATAVCDVLILPAS